jgi:hypothetical protein
MIQGGSMSCRLLSLLVAATVALAATPGRAVVFCQKKRGKRVVLRDRCRKRERELPAAEVGSVGPTGAPGSDGAKGDPGGVRIVDSTGREVGVVVGLASGGSIVLVSHPSLGQPTVFLASQAGFVELGPRELKLYHQQPGCSDAPIVVDPQGYPTFSFVPSALVGAGRAYVATGAPQTYDYVSWESPETSCPGTTSRGLCCTSGVGTVDASPAREIDLATLGFTPPFRLAP